MTLKQTIIGSAAAIGLTVLVNACGKDDGRKYVPNSNPTQVSVQNGAFNVNYYHSDDGSLRNLIVSFDNGRRVCFYAPGLRESCLGRRNTDPLPLTPEAARYAQNAAENLGDLEAAFRSASPDSR